MISDNPLFPKVLDIATFTCQRVSAVGNCVVHFKVV